MFCYVFLLDTAACCRSRRGGEVAKVTKSVCVCVCVVLQRHFRGGRRGGVSVYGWGQKYDVYNSHHSSSGCVYVCVYIYVYTIITITTITTPSLRNKNNPITS